MAKKKRKSAVVEVVDKIVSSVVLENLKSTAKDILKQAQKTAYLTEQKILETVAAGVFLFLGIIFVAISLVMMINNTLKLESQWGYLTVGLAIIIIALLFRQYINKTKIQ